MVHVSRRYGGQDAAARVAERRLRLVAAGLELMGTRGVAGTTVRGVAEQSGLAARYFYESFDHIEALQMAVFDHVAEEAAQRCLVAFADAPADDRGRIRAVLTEVTDFFLDDPRKGHILVVESAASPELGRRASGATTRFAGMLAAAVHGGDPTADPADVPALHRLVSQFLIGGVTSALGAVLQKDIVVDRAGVIDTLVALFTTIRDAHVAVTGNEGHG
jgi:AcrR family transcriptional regulator